MIKPEQIPDEVVEAALEAWKTDTETFHPNAGTIAAAINAWPGAEIEKVFVEEDYLILPLRKENTND